MENVENVENVKTRRPRTALKGKDPEVFQTAFNNLIKANAVKQGDRPDLSKGYLKVDKTRQEIVQSLQDEGYEFIMQQQGESQVNGTLNSLINSYSRTVANTVIAALKSKLIKEEPEFVNFASFHTFLVDKSKGQFKKPMTWSEIHAEDPAVFRTWAEEFIQGIDEAPTQVLKFNADSRGRTRQLDSDLDDCII